MTSDDMIILPVVDIGRLLGSGNLAEAGDAPGDAVRSLATACEQFGMFCIGLGAEDMRCVQAAFRAARALFDLPDAVKLATVPEHPRSSAARGYIGRGAESGGVALEHKEGFSYAKDLPRGRTPNILQAANVWPECTSTCASLNIRDRLEEFRCFVVRISRTLGHAMACALRDPEFVQMVDEGDDISLMRLFHYFPEVAAETNWIGSSPHTDWGLFTVIAQEPTPDRYAALQLYVDGGWRPVRAADNSLICNCGDFLQLRTSGRWRSPLHRVVLSPRDRLSFVYFQYPGFGTPMPPMTSQQAQHVDDKHLLSLLRNQSESAVRTWATKGKSFGDALADKWYQVTRQGEPPAIPHDS